MDLVSLIHGDIYSTGDGGSSFHLSIYILSRLICKHTRYKMFALEKWNIIERSPFLFKAFSKRIEYTYMGSQIII